MAAKKLDPLKEKEKKQKKIAIGGAVVLVALLAFQGPRTLKMLKGHPTPPPPAATATPPAGSPSLAAPTLHGSDAATTGAGGDLASATGPTQVRLRTFSRFASKDPFVPQISDAVSGSAAPAPSTSASPSSVSASPSLSAAAPSGAPSSGGGSAPVAAATPQQATPAAPAAASGGSTTAPAAAPAPASAILTVNGVLQGVTPGSDFPQPSATDPDATPYFHLVSVTATTAKISVAGGSYANGAKTVTLHLKKPVTLVNTADGTRYRIVLMPPDTPLPQASGASGATP